MLLYTRLAAPKAPKRRSRAGCSFCKEKKKKCDEVRPACSRCQENNQSCIYEPIKPRQRRRQDLTDAGGFDDNGQCASKDSSTENLPLHTVQEINQGCEEENQVPESHVSSFGVSDSVAEAYLTWNQDDMNPTCFADTSNALDFPGIDGSLGACEDGPDQETPSRSVVPFQAALTLRPSEQPHQPHQIYQIYRPSASPFPTPSPSLNLLGRSFAEFSPKRSRRALMDHFCNVLSHLIVLREDNGNPFQQLVLPISHRSQTVMNAMFALAGAHLEGRGVQVDEKSVVFHSQAIQGLTRLIQKGDAADRNEVLAAIIFLVYYEVLVQKDRSSIVEGHLKGAMAIMNRSSSETDSTGAFLERAFRFYDVIAALSLGTAPHSTAPVSERFAPFPPPDSLTAGSAFGNIDSLLGMAKSLWPIIHRLSNMKEIKDQLDEAVLRSQPSKAAVLRTELETTASAIESALDRWEPDISSESSLYRDVEDSSGKTGLKGRFLRSVVNSALAYRHSAFVYLYRTIYGQPHDHAVVQKHAHISLRHCLATVINGGPMGALLWPLFVAACEAISPEDRDLAREAFVGIEQRQGMTNIQRSWLVVQEVWRRTDNQECGDLGDENKDTSAASKKDLWRKVSGDLGVTIVFG